MEELGEREKEKWVEKEAEEGKGMGVVRRRRPAVEGTRFRERNRESTF